jgi:hypothetical protein
MVRAGKMKTSDIMIIAAVLGFIVISKNNQAADGKTQGAQALWTDKTAPPASLLSVASYIV